MKNIAVLLAFALILKFYGGDQSVFSIAHALSSDVSVDGLREEESSLSNDRVLEGASLQETIALPVIFRAYYRTTLSSELTTKVLNITKRMGERFEKGDLLIQLDDSVYQGLKEKALGNLAKAETQYTAKNELYQDHIASFMEVKSAQADVAVAKSDLIYAEHAIRACHVVAPYNGKVVSVMVEEHELIQEGKPLMEIVDDDDLIGQVLVPSQYLQKAQLNNEIRIGIPELSKSVEGKIYRVDPVIDPGSSTFKIDVLVRNKDGALKSGMIGQTNLDVRETTEAPKSVTSE